ncbi:MAG TPA: hypothetical protein VGQ96_01330, partial [Candidatus Eremiobacteraceae bacterium]|nr:hypothetical protein [Candidatus Eremiobacteraceae bacterium]
CTTLRAADPDCNVSLGDGSWDVINGQPSGLAARALRDTIDFYGPHFYPKETDALRHSAFASFAMRMLQPFERPVLLEEFGCSSDQADDASAAAYYRTVLWSAFGAGNCGALFWNSHDFTVTDRPPYSHHPYELHFGVIRRDGSRKPQANEVARFASFVAKHNGDAWEPEPAAVAIGRTSYYLSEFPFDWGWTKPELRDLYLQSFTTCVRAGLNAGFADLDFNLAATAKLLIVPCLQQVTTQDARCLERFVRDGGTVYLSYGGEPWFPDLGAFVGARPVIRYGLVDPHPSNFVQFTLARNFGHLDHGAELRFAVRGELRRRAPLECRPIDAVVVATDQYGKPALLERRIGSGCVVFMTYPLEYYALGGLDANATDETWKLYRAVAQKAHALPHVRASESLVQCFCWRSTTASGRRRIVLVNHASDVLETDLLDLTGKLTDVESGESIAARTIRLDAKGVRVFDVTTN